VFAERKIVEGNGDFDDSGGGGSGGSTVVMVARRREGVSFIVAWPEKELCLWSDSQRGPS
jgi:hypothetical protein